MKRKFLLLLFLIASAFISYAQSRFYKRLSGLSMTYEMKIVATPDGGWITGGTSDGIKLLKYDKCGILEWSKHYQSPQLLNCFEIVASRFGGYALTGYSGVSVYSADTYLLRLDNSGNVLFCREYQASSNEYTYSLGEDSKGNFIINGNTTPGTGGNNFILKTDSLGNIAWCKLYSQSGMWAHASMCSDDGILRCGGYGNIYKVDSSGVLLWAKYGYFQARYEPMEVSDGFVFPSYSSTRGYVFKTDLNGDPLWFTKQYLTPASIQRVAQNSNGNLVVVNSSFAIEYNNNGNYVNHNHFADPVTSVSPTITDICRLSDNSFVMAGFDSPSFNGRMDSLLLTGCADQNTALDTIPNWTFNIRDTSYVVGNKTFFLATIPVTAVDIYPIEVVVCEKSDSISFMTSLPDTICSGESIVLSVTDQSESDISWNWYADSCGGSFNGNGLSLSVSPGSTETYFLEAKGCDTTACIPLTVNVIDKPVAAFQAEYFADCKGLWVDLKNESSNADSYTWNFDDGFTSTQTDISHDLGDDPPFSVSLIAVNSNSCRDTLTLQNSLSSFQDYFNITLPNVFTPNNDGINDELEIITSADLSDCFSIRIFDRWGLELFTSKSINHKWDGRTISGQKAAQGTYFYLLEIGDIEYKGQLALVE